MGAIERMLESEEFWKWLTEQSVGGFQKRRASNAEVKLRIVGCLNGERQYEEVLTPEASLGTFVIGSVQGFSSCDVAMEAFGLVPVTSSAGNGLERVGRGRRFAMDVADPTELLIWGSHHPNVLDISWIHIGSRGPFYSEHAVMQLSPQKILRQYELLSLDVCEECSAPPAGCGCAKTRLVEILDARMGSTNPTWDLLATSLHGIGSAETKVTFKVHLRDIESSVTSSVLGRSESFFVVQSNGIEKSESIPAYFTDVDFDALRNVGAMCTSHYTSGGSPRENIASSSNDGEVLKIGGKSPSNNVISTEGHPTEESGSSTLQLPPLVEQTSTEDQGNGKFRCMECNQLLASKSNLSRHVRMVHNKLRPHQCGICFLVFVQSSGLRRHAQRFHGGRVVSPPRNPPNP